MCCYIVLTVFGLQAHSYPGTSAVYLKYIFYIIIITFAIDLKPVWSAFIYIHMCVCVLCG